MSVKIHLNRGEIGKLLGGSEVDAMTRKEAEKIAKERGTGKLQYKVVKVNKGLRPTYIIQPDYK